MFRFVPRRLAIGAYSMFMIEQKNNPKLKGLAIADRGKMTSKLYNSLSASDRAQLEKRAAAYVSPNRAAKGKVGATKPRATAAAGAAPKKPRKASAYATFVKENIHKFDKLPHRDRMKAVAKLWKQQQQRTGH